MKFEKTDGGKETQQMYGLEEGELKTGDSSSDSDKSVLIIVKYNALF